MDDKKFKARVLMKYRFILLVFVVSFVVGCKLVPTKHPDDVCIVFKEKASDDWYEYAKASADKWGVPIDVQMAIMYQESHFVADARAPRIWLLGFIPWFRESSSYGYAQVTDGTWDTYLNDAGSWWSDRDDFSDAIDFIGWYGNKSYLKLGVPKWDAKNQYLAYHEGLGGYRSKHYLKNTSLKKLAEKVERRAKVFKQQLSNCKMN